MKQVSETWSKVKKTGKLRHSGHTQNPLRSAFPIIMLARVIHVYCTRAERLYAQLSFLGISIVVITTLANSPHGMGDCAHHQCVVISVH